MALSWPDWLTPKPWRPATGSSPPAPVQSPLHQSVADRFPACLAIVLGHEGGFSNDPQDPGGATNLGITRTTLAAWRGRAVTEAEVLALSRDEAMAIYRARYWDVMRCGDLPAGLDLMVFDFGVNAGPGAGARMLQRAVGAPPDGAVGPVTLAAALRADRPAAIDRMAKLREDHYRALPTFGRFGRGWLRRTEEVRQAAHRMVSR
jgi:lysozyme family protein